MTDGFMPHGVCLGWDGPLLTAFIVGNLGIALAYLLIPMALRYFIGKRKDLPYSHIFKLFAAFILSCGLTHVAKVLTLYQPVYWVEAGLDLWTAGISLITAAVLFPLIPKALQLRSPKELEEANKRLEAQIIETKKAESLAEAARAEAEVARDQAVKANALKSQFVANISHEIRTPMSGVIGMAELLTNSPDPEEANELAIRVYDSSKKLLDVLNALLDFSKLESGKVEIEKIAFDPHQLVKDAVALAEPNAVSKGLRIETNVDLPNKLIGDESKVRQILLNFLHNAVKFTNEGTVRVSAVIEKESKPHAMVRFSVSDSGIGIREKDQTALFQPFVQADGSTQRRFGGTGLGLSIAKQFVELMEGEIGFDSEESKGSVFWFSVPLELAEDV